MKIKNEIECFVQQSLSLRSEICVNKNHGGVVDVLYEVDLELRQGSWLSAVSPKAT